MFKLSFWKNKESGNFLTHKNGLTKEMIQDLQALKEGDRLILWVNSEKLSDTSPDLTMKVFSSGRKHE